MAASATATIPCEFEFQVADARTGLNKTTALYRQTVMIRRRGGLELAADDPPVHKALKMQTHVHEGKPYFLLASIGNTCTDEMMASQCTAAKSPRAS